MFDDLFNLVMCFSFLSFFSPILVRFWWSWEKIRTSPALTLHFNIFYFTIFTFRPVDMYACACAWPNGMHVWVWVRSFSIRMKSDIYSILSISICLKLIAWNGAYNMASLLFHESNVSLIHFMSFLNETLLMKGLERILTIGNINVCHKRVEAGGRASKRTRCVYSIQAYWWLQ